jgi:phosphatidylethanolamine-binding protein (PEBP) family uncharacterized protein
MGSPGGLRKQSLTAVGVAFVLGLVIAGCGGSGTTTQAPASKAPSAIQTATTAASTDTAPKATSTHTEKVPEVKITVGSSVKLRPLPSRYTCDGADISPPLSWGQVPANTVEVDLFVADESAGSTTVIDWAVAGLAPTVHTLSAGRLPAGTIVGRNSLGLIAYSICPRRGSKASYVVLVDPLPRRIATKRGFSSEALVKQVIGAAESEGQLGFSYTRAGRRHP